MDPGSESESESESEEEELSSSEEDSPTARVGWYIQHTFDFFLPKPSLSTTSSAHLILLPSVLSARRRSVGRGGGDWGRGRGVVSVWVWDPWVAGVERVVVLRVWAGIGGGVGVEIMRVLGRGGLDCV